MSVERPKGFDLDGTFIEFPFDPYDCQKEYMRKVLTACKEVRCLHGGVGG
jgi:hypothetical protein